MPRHPLLAYLPALGFALYPLSVTLAMNTGTMPLPATDVLRAAAGGLVPAATALLLVALLARGRAAAGLWLACLLFLLVSYGWVLAPGWLVAAANTEAAPTAGAYVAAALVIATLLIRPWDRRPRDPVPLLIVAAAMLAVNLLTAAWASPTHEPRWRPIARQLADIRSTPSAPGAGPSDDAATIRLAAATATSTPGSSPARDIYYIVLDGFGRPDVLRQLYDLDLSATVAALRARGFYVPERARSNYAQTYLSLASTLNLTYLEPLAPAVGVSSVDRRPLHAMIRANALMRLARQAGYDISVISSDYSATRTFVDVDHCACDQYGLSELEQAAIGLTPLAGLPLTAWTHDAHRRKLLSSLAAIERPLPVAGRRTFTFAHLIAPHPPFVFAADGSARTPSYTLGGLRDGDHFPGRPLEYIDGYRQQAQFVASRVLHVVEALLSRPGPKPAIVIHGDHGPGSRLRWEDPGASSMDERFGIFAAYYLPDDSPGASAPLYPTMTPVNGARALAVRYFHVEAPFLPDESRFSTWSHPYDLLPVPPE